MKRILLATALVIACVSAAHSDASSDSTCDKDRYEVVELLLNLDAKCGDALSNRDLRDAIRVVDSYWSWETNSAQRFELLERDYQELVSEIYGINKPSEYKIPYSEEEKFWSGYSISTVRSYAENSLEISTMVRWDQEGFSGATTFIFSLVKTAEGWRITQIVS